MTAPTQPHHVPVRDCVGAALRFVRENWRFIGATSAIGAVAVTIVGALVVGVPAFGVLSGVVSAFIQATTYAAFLGAMLFGATAVRERAMSDGGRVLAAMAIVALFLVLIMVVLSIPVFMALAVGPLAPYREALTAAGDNRERVTEIMLQFAEANPGALLIVALFYFAVWFILTSRLYIAAPASVDQRRILTFETWAWTKGATFRIIAARLMLLLPAYVFVYALTYLAGQSVGVNVLDVNATNAVAAANPGGFLIYVLINSFITFAFYASLEAGLSAAIYQRLKPLAR
jgi:hypothetical protein